jgi:hypothetical protein
MSPDGYVFRIVAGLDARIAISNLHDIGKWGPILGTGRLIFPAHFKEQIAPAAPAARTICLWLWRA